MTTLTDRSHAQYAPGIPYEVPITNELLTDGLAHTIRAYPQRVAMDFFGKEITYQQFGDEVRRAASVLASKGITKGDRIALILPNCPQAAIAFYGGLYLGAIVAQHNPLAPACELLEQIERHGAKVILAWDKISDRLSPLLNTHTIFTINMISAMPWTYKVALKLPVKAARDKREQLHKAGPTGTISWDKAVRRSLPIRTPVARISSDAPAVLLHTGGTTGVPKAVVLSHKNIVTNIESGKLWMPMLREGAEVFYNALPYFHAFGLTMTLVGAVRFGATAVVFPKFDLDLFVSAMKRRPATFMLGVPPMFERFAKVAREKKLDMSSFVCAVAGAMPLTKAVAQEWEDLTSGLIVEGYGMSETSPILTGSPMDSSRRHASLGVLFPSVQGRIVDPDNPTIDVEPGQVGELIIQGPCVCDGYWNNPEETAKLFTSQGWLRTGDLVREDDGFLIMADRRKELILSGGFNVYPSQVEAALRQMPGIEDVAVVGLPVANGEEVVAAVVLEKGADSAAVTLTAIRQWAEKSLSHYALPRQIAVISELPRSQIGKVMRRAVREQLQAAGATVQSVGEQVTTATGQLFERTMPATSTIVNPPQTAALTHEGPAAQASQQADS